MEELIRHLESIDPTLNDFLLEKGARDKFLTNISRNINDLQKFKSSGRISNIGNSFIWLDTPEGDDFWMDLDDKFMALDNKQIKLLEDVTNFVKRYSH